MQLRKNFSEPLNANLPADELGQKRIVQGGAVRVRDSNLIASVFSNIEATISSAKRVTANGAATTLASVRR
jgi:hypothetical protein